MSDDKYNEMFAYMAMHNRQETMTAQERAEHLRDIARREDAEGIVEEFVSQWLSTEEQDAQDGPPAE